MVVFVNIILKHQRQTMTLRKFYQNQNTDWIAGEKLKQRSSAFGGFLKIIMQAKLLYMMIKIEFSFYFLGRWVGRANYIFADCRRETETKVVCFWGILLDNHESHTAIHN